MIFTVRKVYKKLFTHQVQKNFMLISAMVQKLQQLVIYPLPLSVACICHPLPVWRSINI